MSGQVRRAVRAVTILALTFATTAALAAPSQAAPVKKQYTASISPTTGIAGVPESFTVTITNKPTSTQSLGSANITVPSSFTALALGALTPPSGKTWTAALSGNVVQLRNPGPGSTHALAPGQSVGIVIDATPTASGTYTFTTQTKQSNDFLGTGNDFTISGSQPQVTVTGNATLCGSGTCSVQTSNFGSGPTEGDPVAGRATLETGSCESDCYLAIDTESCGPTHGCINNELFFRPPANAAGPVTVEYLCDQSACAGEDASNPVYKEDEEGNVTLLSDCPSSEPSSEDLPCVLSRSRDPETGVLSLVIVLNPTDPRLRTG